MSLTHVPEITVKDYAVILNAAIKNGGNILIFGPSGAGKTVIAQDVAREKNCRLVYINLSTLERTDFQGFPVVSEDKTVVHYATPEFMPFSDVSFKKDRRVVKSALKELLDKEGNIIDKNNQDLVSDLQNRLDYINSQERLFHLRAALPYLKANTKTYNTMKSLITELKNKEDKPDLPIVVLFDEVDKAASETNQPLLEFLQFSSINGRSMNIACCVLTANLPDENAHSNNISQAISKRCLSYKLEINFDLWRDWAFRNGVNELITQFLQYDPSMLFRPGSPDGDPTAYAQPAPRTWTQAGLLLSRIEDDKEYQTWKPEKLDRLHMLMISGAVGTAAALKWEAWYKYYRKFDSAITKLIENGEDPRKNIKDCDINDQEELIIAISACCRHVKEIRDDNGEKLQKITKNVYKWLSTIKEEHQIAVTRMSFSLTNDEDFQQKVIKHKLLNIPEFRDCFDKINKKFRNYGVTSKKN
jgi:MoxR-like ATPase